MSIRQSSHASTGTVLARPRHIVLTSLATSVLLALATSAHAQSMTPTGGVVVGGGATIVQADGNLVIRQSTGNVAINWQSFNIGSGQSVTFVQPGSSSVALNRVLGADPSLILGRLSSNGVVFLLNPNGILFGAGASVSVGGLVASTMSISDADFMAGRHAFTDAGPGSIVNQGDISARDGGFVALMGRSVSNQGVISARLGNVVLAGADAVTLDVIGDGLLNVSVPQGAVNALVQNGGLIRADGGRVLMTAQAAGDLLGTVVNNTGVIQARTIDNRNGTILLLGDMRTGTVNVGGLLDASAANGRHGRIIETSAAPINLPTGTARGGSLSRAGAGGLRVLWGAPPRPPKGGGGGWLPAPSLWVSTPKRPPTPRGRGVGPDRGRLVWLHIVKLNPASDTGNRPAEVAVDLFGSLFGKSTLMRK